MKIIGKTHQGYIVDISGDELANLAGYYSESQSPSGGYNRGPYNVGDTVTVHKMYHQLYNLARISAQADQAKKTLQAARLGIMRPMVTEPLDCRVSRHHRGLRMSVPCAACGNHSEAC